MDLDNRGKLCFDVTIADRTLAQFNEALFKVFTVLTYQV